MVINTGIRPYIGTSNNWHLQTHVFTYNSNSKRISNAEAPFVERIHRGRIHDNSIKAWQDMWFF
jgi:hypothetical protein